jgi:kinetochore protein NDC80
MGEIEVEDDAMAPERLFFNYLTVAYKLFLAGDDDFSEAEGLLEQEFEKRNATTHAEIERLEKESDVYTQQIEKLNQQEVRKGRYIEAY